MLYDGNETPSLIYFTLDTINIFQVKCFKVLNRWSKVFLVIDIIKIEAKMYEIDEKYDP